MKKQRIDNYFQNFLLTMRVVYGIYRPIGTHTVRCIEKRIRGYTPHTHNNLLLRSKSSPPPEESFLLI